MNRFSVIWVCARRHAFTYPSSVGSTGLCDEKSFAPLEEGPEDHDLARPMDDNDDFLLEPGGIAWCSLSPAVRDSDQSSLRPRQRDLDRQETHLVVGCTADTEACAASLAQGALGCHVWDFAEWAAPEDMQLSPMRVLLDVQLTSPCHKRARTTLNFQEPPADELLLSGNPGPRDQADSTIAGAQPDRDPPHDSEPEAGIPRPAPSTGNPQPGSGCAQHCDVPWMFESQPLMEAVLAALRQHDPSRFANVTHKMFSWALSGFMHGHSQLIAPAMRYLPSTRLHEPDGTPAVLRLTVRPRETWTALPHGEKWRQEDVLFAVAELMPTSEIGVKGPLQAALRGAGTCEPHEEMDITDVDPTSVAVHAAALMVGVPIRLRIREDPEHGMQGTYEVTYPCSPLRIGEPNGMPKKQVLSQLKGGLGTSWNGATILASRRGHNLLFSHRSVVKNIAIVPEAIPVPRTAVQHEPVTYVGKWAHNCSGACQSGLIQFVWSIPETTV